MSSSALTRTQITLGKEFNEPQSRNIIYICVCMIYISLLPAFANFPVLSSKACFRPFSKLDQPWISSESGHLDSLTVERKKRSIQNPGRAVVGPESSRHHITQFDMLEIATISLLPAFANFPVLSSKACFRPFSKLDQPWISSESGHLDSLTVERKKRSIQNPPFQFYPVRKIERSTGQENFESSVMVFFDKGSRLWTSN